MNARAAIIAAILRRPGECEAMPCKLIDRGLFARTSTTLVIELLLFANRKRVSALIEQRWLEFTPTLTQALAQSFVHPPDSKGIRSGGKFVESRAGEAYDARASRPSLLRMFGMRELGAVRTLPASSPEEF